MKFNDFTRDILSEKVSQRSISRKKVEKWDRFGLLEGLQGQKKTHMARLLENQAASLIKEASDTSDIKGFQAVAFPMVRRVFGQLLAQEIVSVQPMALPAGLIFWLDFTYGTQKAGATQAAGNWQPGKSVYGDPLSPLTGGAAGTGGHYDLHSAYTQREASGTVGVISSASVTLWSELGYNPQLSSSLATAQIFKLTVDLDADATITNVDATNYTNFAISGTAAALGANFTALPVFNAFNSTTNVLTLYYSGSAGTAGGGVNSGSNVTVSYVKKTPHGADTTGTTLNPAFEYAFDDTDSIPQLDINIKSFPIVAGDRKLKVNWTPEVAQDVNAYHSLDIESELTQIMADQVAMDIDSEILQDLLNQAGTNGEVQYWDVRPGFFVDHNTGGVAAGQTFTGNVEEWYRTLLIRVNSVGNRIFRRNLRGGANFIVTSPDVCTILESIVQWRPEMDHSDPSVTKYSMGIEKAGNLAGKYTVYKAPNFPRNKMLVGYKGDEWLSTGYVYAPYVPLIVTPTVYDPKNFTPAKAVMTRYAKQIVRSDFYGVIYIKGMDA